MNRSKLQRFLFHSWSLPIALSSPQFYVVDIQPTLDGPSSCHGVAQWGGLSSCEYVIWTNEDRDKKCSEQSLAVEVQEMPKKEGQWIWNIVTTLGLGFLVFLYSQALQNLILPSLVCPVPNSKRELCTLTELNRVLLFIWEGQRRGINTEFQVDQTRWCVLLLQTNKWGAILDNLFMYFSIESTKRIADEDSLLKVCSSITGVEERKPLRKCDL